MPTTKRFEDVITFWNDTSQYRTYQRDNDVFRRILMENWPMQVHYEFYCYGKTNEIGIEFHSEAKSVTRFDHIKVKKAVQGFSGLKIKNAKILCSPDNDAMSCWLKIRLPLSNEVKDICEYMAELIKETKQSIMEALLVQTKRQ